MSVSTLTAIYSQSIYKKVTVREEHGGGGGGGGCQLVEATEAEDTMGHPAL